MQRSTVLGLAVLAFAVGACSSDSSAPEERGAIAVTVTTTGQGKDLDGYLVALPGRAPVRIPLSGSAQVEGLSPGIYTVELQDIADNCELLTVLAPITIARDSTSAIDVVIDCHLDLHGRILFSSYQFDPGQIMAMYPDGSQRYRVIESDSLDGDPDLSPDGQFLVFKRFIGNTERLRVLNLSNGVVTALPAQGLGQFRPEWSPDGSKVAYMVAEAQSLLIWVVNADGGNPHAVTSAPGFHTDPEWSPDGNWILYSNGGALERVPSGGGSPVSIPCFGGCIQAVYSPDGESIFYTGNTTQSNQDIYRMDADGSNVDTLTSAPENEQAPVVSADGTTLVFVRYLTGGGTRLYRLDLNGSEPVDVSSGYDDQQPAWGLPPEALRKSR